VKRTSVSPILMAIGALLVFVIAGAGCGGQAPAASPHSTTADSPVTAGLVSTDTPRHPADDASELDLSRLVAGSASFAA
jgi:ABC-type phosphate/phosphonate transport system substrate-binding protein